MKRGSVAGFPRMRSVWAMLPVRVSNRSSLLTPGPPMHSSTRAQLDEVKPASSTNHELARRGWTTTRSGGAKSGVTQSARTVPIPAAEPDPRNRVLTVVPARSLLHRGVAQTLIEPPMVALGVLGLVAPIGPVLLAVVGRLRLHDDLRAGLPRPPAVRLHVVDVDHHVLGIPSADRPRAPAEGPVGAIVPLRAGDHDQPF